MFKVLSLVAHFNWPSDADQLPILVKTVIGVELLDGRLRGGVRCGHVKHLPALPAGDPEEHGPRADRKVEKALIDSPVAYGRDELPLLIATAGLRPLQDAGVVVMGGVFDVKH